MYVYKNELNSASYVKNSNWIWIKSYQVNAATVCLNKPSTYQVTVGVDPVGAAVKVQVNVTGLAFDTVASLDVMTAETD